MLILLKFLVKRTCSIIRLKDDLKWKIVDE